MENASELKSCPFCGSKNLSVHGESGTSSTMYKILCIACGSSGAWNKDRINVIQAWNTRTQSQCPIKGGYFGTHCHICHEAVNDCKCVRQAPESSGLVSPQGVPCIHEWAWSNNSGRYHCNKCQHWSYLGKDEVGTQQSKLVPLDCSEEGSLSYFLDELNISVMDRTKIFDYLSKFGSPTVPSLEDIENVIYKIGYADISTGKEGTSCCVIKNHKDIASAIHRLLTNGKEGK